MAWTDTQQGFKRAYKAASDIPAFACVSFANATEAGAVLRSGSLGQRPIGAVDQATSLRGDGVAVFEDGAVVKAVAAASMGVGAEVYVSPGSTSLEPVAGASGVTRWAVGQSMQAAAAGERFSLRVAPRQLSNLI